MHLTSFRDKSSKKMAFPHPKSRKRNYWNRDIPNNRSAVGKFLKRTINITDYRNREDEVNPAKYGTFGGFFHDWFVTSGGMNFLRRLRCPCVVTRRRIVWKIIRLHSNVIRLGIVCKP